LIAWYKALTGRQESDFENTRGSSRVPSPDLIVVIAREEH
jgi:hypothetical protein